MKNSIPSSIMVTVINLLAVVENGVGTISLLLHVEYNKVIPEEMLVRVTQPAVQSRNVAGKVPGLHLSSKQETLSH